MLLVGWLLSLSGVLLAGARDTARRSDAIVVLGAAQYAGRPSPVLRSRLDHAVNLWNQGMAEHMVLTGGRGTGDTISEAEVGAAFVQKAGIPGSALLMETTGRSTEESLAGVADLMRERQLKTAVLVSDPFHMMRLRLVAWQFGMSVSLSPTRSSPISKSRAETWSHVLGESIKVPFTALSSGVRVLSR